MTVSQAAHEAGVETSRESEYFFTSFTKTFGICLRKR